MINTAHPNPFSANAEATGADLSSISYFTIPVKTKDTKIYKTVQINNEATMANGTSF